MSSADQSLRGQVTGVILAGGKARRMGGVDKGLVSINERPMIAWVIDALRPQVVEVLINANRNHDRYAEFGCPVVADVDRDFRGPLAGFESGMRSARTPYIVVVPCDSPLICNDLVARLHAAVSDERARIAVAHDGQRLQPVFAMLDRTLLDDLAAYLECGGRKIDRWYEQHGFATVDFSDVAGTFVNVNAPADRQLLEGELTRNNRPDTTEDK